MAKINVGKIFLMAKLFICRRKIFIKATYISAAITTTFTKFLVCPQRSLMFWTLFSTLWRGSIFIADAKTELAEKKSNTKITAIKITFMANVTLFLTFWFFILPNGWYTYLLKKISFIFIRIYTFLSWFNSKKDFTAIADFYICCLFNIF